MRTQDSPLTDEQCALLREVERGAFSGVDLRYDGPHSDIDLLVEAGLASRTAGSAQYLEHYTVTDAGRLLLEPVITERAALSSSTGTEVKLWQMADKLAHILAPWFSATSEAVLAWDSSTELHYMYWVRSLVRTNGRHGWQITYEDRPDGPAEISNRWCIRVEAMGLGHGWELHVAGSGSDESPRERSLVVRGAKSRVALVREAWNVLQ